MKKRIIMLIVVSLILPQFMTAKDIPAKKSSKSPYSIKQPPRPLTQEEVEKQMLEDDIRTFRPQVLELIDRVKRNMGNETLCPMDKQTVS